MVVMPIQLRRSSEARSMLLQVSFWFLCVWPSTILASTSKFVSHEPSFITLGLRLSRFAASPNIHLLRQRLFADRFYRLRALVFQCPPVTTSTNSLGEGKQSTSLDVTPRTSQLTPYHRNQKVKQQDL